MDDKNKDILFGQIRNLLMGGTGWLIGKGYLTADIATSLVGVVMFLLPMAWSWWAHRQAEAKVQLRETAAVQSGINLAQERDVHEPVLPKDAQQIIKAYGPPIVANNADITAGNVTVSETKKE